MQKAPSPPLESKNQNEQGESKNSSLGFGASSSKDSGVSMTRVKNFYEAESARVGSIDKDPVLTEKRLREFASTLKEEEIRWLAIEAENRSNPGDGRFFSVYLLALSEAPSAIEALSKLAVMPIPQEKNVGLVELERQLRAQATEGIARACEKQKQWKDSLLDIVSRQDDEFLRDRAHRALYQCETGKSIEDQDKEALEKVRKAPGSQKNSKKKTSP